MGTCDGPPACGAEGFARRNRPEKNALRPKWLSAIQLRRGSGTYVSIDWRTQAALGSADVVSVNDGGARLSLPLARQAVVLLVVNWQ